MQRNQRIDLLRGWLILFVIIGHIVLGSVHTNEIRYSIYAFHMPLFIALSGYLINHLKLGQTSLLDLLITYWWRVLLPFAFAFAFFSGVLWFHAWQEGRLDTAMIIGGFVTPYYHLWFIPTLVIWVLGYWCALNLRLPLKALSLFFIVVTLSWAVIPREKLPFIAAALLSKKVVYFYGFFLFGALAKSGAINKLLRLARDFKVLPMALIFLCALLYLIHIGPDKTALKGISWLFMNLLLFLTSLVWIESAKQSHQNYKGYLTVLVTMGRISLPIYLWHMAPMFVLKGFDVHQSHPLIYYTVSLIVTVSIIWALIKLEHKSAWVNKVVYGH